MRKKDQHHRRRSSSEEPVKLSITFTDDDGDSDDETPHLQLENEVDDLEDGSSDSPKSKSCQYNRANHNELEKNRRAQLKISLDKLKDLVPANSVHKQTTIGLLMKSKRFIEVLQDREKKHLACKDQLQKEQKFLKRKLELLQQLYNGSGATGSSTIALNRVKEEVVSCSSNTNWSSNLPHILKRKVQDRVSSANRIPESGCLVPDDSYYNGSPHSSHGITVLREVYTPANYSNENICFIISDTEYSAAVEYDNSSDPTDGSSDGSSSSLDRR